MELKIKLSGIAIILVAQQAVAAPITSFDQFTLELLNNLRANPQAFANTHLGGNLNEGVPLNETISAGAKQPLAWDLNLVASAQGHNNDMIANNFFDHTGSNGSTPDSRITNAGYSWQTYGENLAVRGQTGLSGVTAAITEQMNTDLFVDKDVADRGHRINMLNNNFEAVGISVGFSLSFAPLQGFPSDVVTLDFGANSQGAFLTGVAYNDGDLNHFYTPGEGLGGLSVLAYQAGTTNLVKSTTTLEAGGYALDLGVGLYDLKITGGLGDLFVQNIALGSQNLKFDYNNATVVPIPAALWLFASGLLGISGFGFKHRKIKAA